MRPSFAEIFMKNAEQISERATCNRLKVGATLVKNNHAVMSGYNGSIRGHSHCNDVDCLKVDGHCKRTIHAEMNVLLSCAREGIATEGTTIYVTHFPCPDCMKALNQAGIKEVVYKEMYAHKFENNFAHGMTITKYKE